MAFRNCKLEELRFLTGAVVSVRDTKNNSAVHFPVVPYSVDIIKSLLGKRSSVKLTNRDDENPQHFSVEFGNLYARKAFVERDVTLNIPNKYVDHPLLLAA